MAEVLYLPCGDRGSLSRVMASRIHLVVVTLNHLVDGNGATAYTYDAAGNLGKAAYPNRVAHNYAYDTRNRLANLGVAESLLYLDFLGALRSDSNVKASIEISPAPVVTSASAIAPSSNGVS
jgi:YD repeat-containing protein